MCRVFSVRRVGVLAAFLLLFICPLLANSQTNRFILLGDLHYDLLEDHDFEWLEINAPATIPGISNLCAITEANWDDFMTHLQGVIETNTPSVKGVIQLGDLSNGLAGDSKADQMAASAMEAVEQSGLGVPWILAKGNHDVTFGLPSRIAFDNHYLPMICKQTDDDSIQMANYSYRSGSVEIFVCDYYSRNSVDPIAWLDAAAQASTAPVKVAVFHEPVIPVTERCWHMYRTDEVSRQRLLQVMASNNLIALVGHLHRYSVVRRTTQWGPIVQIMASSVIKNRNAVSTDRVITQYGPSIATDSSYVTAAATLEEREAILAAEQPYVTFYKQCSLQGFGVLNVDETTSKVVLNYYGGFSTEPFDTMDITALQNPISIEIPDVVGQTQIVAESNITIAGFIVGTENNQYSSTVPAGDVISQSPVGGSVAAMGIPVNLVVSLGTQVSLPNTFDIPVVDGRDDAEQTLADGTVHTGSSDLEMVDDNFDFGMQTVGVRFRNIPLTAGQTISKAYIQFAADPILGYSSSVTFTIQGEAADYSSVFTTAAYDISSRTKTTASVSWSPAAWTAGAAGAAEQTADITSILNEIIARPGWNANNAISLIFTGASGIRRAESYEGDAAKAPVLHIECDGGVASPATTAWSPVTGNDHWTDDANWSDGIAPLDPYQNLRVEFNVEGAQECILDTRAVVRQLALGDNGTDNGIFLRLSSGADLVCGAKPDGGTEWTSIGYNRPATLTVEVGAAFEVAGNLLIGFSGTGDSRLDIDGGLVNVNATIKLGNEANTSRGVVTIDDGGQLWANRLTFTNASSVVDVRNGLVVLARDQTSAVNGYIAAGNLIAYGGVGQLEADYNLSHSGFTTVSATASGYDIWAVEHGIGAGNDDDDGDSQGNFYEYVMRGNPTNALDRGIEPSFFVQNGELIYAHLHRNDDPGLVYSLEATTNLANGIWTDAVSTIVGTNVLGGAYDEIINEFPADNQNAFIRLKITNL